MIATEAVQEGTTGEMEAGPARRAGDLTQPVPVVSPAQTNRDVIHFFKDHPEQGCLPVVEEDVPIGMINRGIFLTGFSMPFHREVYERKSCIAFMDKRPLVVDAAMPVAELGRLAVEAGAKVLQDGFLVTREGRYEGLGAGLDLLRALGALESERHRVVRESIEYAQVIQGALLATSQAELQAAGLADRHLLWKPKDQVGGDAFLAKRVARDGRSGVFLALMDCTGHGVPGAFTAMLMTSFLGHALDRAQPWEPGRVLAEVNRRVKEELGQHHREGEPEAGSEGADEGMDATCLWVDREGVVFAGARHSLWILKPGAKEMEEVRGDRAGVGYVATPDDQSWTSRPLAAGSGDTLVAFSDGVVDQIGGPRRIAFGKKRLWDAFLEGDVGTGLRTRLERVYSAMEIYQGAEERRDDVCLLGIRL